MQRRLRFVRRCLGLSQISPKVCLICNSPVPKGSKYFCTVQCAETYLEREYNSAR